MQTRRDGEQRNSRCIDGRCSVWCNLSTARLNASCSVSVHSERSLDMRPAVRLSSGASRDEQSGRTRANILHAPMNERIDFTVAGLSQLANAAMRCGLACIVSHTTTYHSA